MFRLPQFLLISLLFGTLSGCAMVSVGSVSTDDYLSARRGDVLTTGTLSASARTALQVLGMDEERCSADKSMCRTMLIASIGLSDEQRLSTVSELWLQEALQLQEAQKMEPASEAIKTATLSAFLHSAKHAYAYLFFTPRPPDSRALEDRQAQVRDYYNFSSQEAVVGLFNRYRNQLEESVSQDKTYLLDFEDWQINGNTTGITLSHKGQLPNELVTASSLTFKGLRNQYRRDGLGAELVAVFANSVVKREDENKSWSETPFPSITVMLRFPGSDIQNVLASKQVEVQAFDPHKNKAVAVQGVQVPLAANFTAGYGLWLARSGFAQESLLSLIGRSETLDKPRIYLMQPYDPKRQVILMLHGLASSPEAWVNVANEVLGDEALRQNYQIWQVYYPTNLPLAFNNREIREAAEATLKNFDPQGSHPASSNMVLVGHSMGGVLARLMVSNSGDQLWDQVVQRYNISRSRKLRLKEKIEPYVIFTAMPQVTRAIFIAAPHRGTAYAENRFARFVSGLIRLPATVLSRVTEIGQLLVNSDSVVDEPLVNSINSIKNLSDQDPFVQESAKLPISGKVTYHSIMGNDTPHLKLSESSDGVVPYASAKLEGAASELVVNSWHSVQEKPEAIVEIRRILHAHLRSLD